MIAYVSTTGYALATGLFLVLSLLLLTAWRGRLLGGLLLAACATSIVWSGMLTLYAGQGIVPLAPVSILEIARDIAWLLFLRGVLGSAVEDDSGLTIPVLFAIALTGGVVVGTATFLEGRWFGLPIDQIQLVTFLVYSVLGLAFIEQLFRGTRREDRWQIKFLCIGLGLQFAYDFFLYSHAILFKQLDPELWAARGVVQAAVVPFIALTAVRNPEWSVQIFVSRHVVFGSAALVGAGAYLVLMSAAGFYIRTLGGAWGRTGEIIFFCGALALLAILLSSQQVRSRAKVLLTKHFFRNKYDYRETWLAFTQALSGSHSDAELREHIVQGIADLVDSPGGAMWVADDQGNFRRSALWGVCPELPGIVPVDEAFTAFVRETHWVIYTQSCVEDPAEYGGLKLPQWLLEANLAMVVPLLHQGELLGLVGLVSPRTPRRFDWEDTDLLKTLSRQAGGYLALLQLTEELAQAKQFEAFNRLSSFVVHDLKNLVAQLALVVTNSERHLDNPAFVRDAISTVSNASDRMRRMLDQLRKGRMEDTSIRLVNVGRIVTRAMEDRNGELPLPTIERLEEGLVVRADAERLRNVLGHVVQNAQEATPDSGEVKLSAYLDADGVCIEIRDNGTGMAPEFVEGRLFRPFETTKGNAGMGIGVYETRELVRLWGGEVEVESELGIGTCFKIRLPVGQGGTTVIARSPAPRLEAAS